MSLPLSRIPASMRRMPIDDDELNSMPKGSPQASSPSHSASWSVGSGPLLQ